MIENLIDTDKDIKAILPVAFGALLDLNFEYRQADHSFLAVIKFDGSDKCRARYERRVNGPVMELFDKMRKAIKEAPESFGLHELDYYRNEALALAKACSEAALSNSLIATPGDKEHE